VLKAAVCSVICSFTENSFTISGPALVKAVMGSPVIHILSPMVRQIFAKCIGDYLNAERRHSMEVVI
jgi:hypothetical protein